MKAITPPRITGLALAAGAIWAIVALASPATADELFDAWSVVPEQGLDVERGRNVDDADDLSIGSGAAINIAEQTVVNYFNVEGDVSSGDITMGSHTFANQNMSINAFNTGNNVTMMNQLSIQLNLSTGN